MLTMNAISLINSRLCCTRLFLQRQTGFVECRNRYLATTKKKKFCCDDETKASISLSTATATIVFLTSCDADYTLCEELIATPTRATQVPVDQANTIKTPNWVIESTSTKAKCSTHISVHQEEVVPSTKNEGEGNDGISRFDAANSEYYEIQLERNNGLSNTPPKDPLDATDCLTSSKSNNPQPLHNTIIVMPNLLTLEECEMIVEDTERILDEKHRMEVQGVKTESWTIYSNFDLGCQGIIRRVLENVVLDFIESRLPDVEQALFHRNKECFDAVDSKDVEHNTQDKQSNNNPAVPKGMSMDYYWDDPVVIKYKAGNKLAPHDDDRDLTIVVPLNPLDSFPLDGGGTRFWLEGTTPETANETSGISVKPRCGSGIIFNGNIIHSGNSVIGGTRYVLMTSITLDDSKEEEGKEDCEDTE